MFDIPDEPFTTENGFNLKDASHRKGTNRYVFSYPETWYSTMNERKLTFGLRSIILKPAPVDLNLSAFSLVRCPNGLSLEPYLQETYNDQNKLIGAYLQPDLNGILMFDDRYTLDIYYEIIEGKRLIDVCDTLNELADKDLIHYANIYRNKKELYEARCPDAQYSDFQIDPGAISFTFTRDRSFIMETNNRNLKFMVEYYRDDEKVNLLEETDLNAKDHVQTTEDEYYIVNGFNEDFESLMSLHLPPEKSLNNILSGLAGINKNYTIEEAKKDCETYGITFEGVQTIKYNILPLYEPTDDPQVYDINKPVSKGQYSYNILFSRLIVKNVWSRKDILLRSSIAELDRNYYFGYSTMTNSSPVCIYATPKMYLIKDQTFTFWVDLYDSFNEDPVELPENVVMIIEAALVLSPKPIFYRQ